MIKCCTDGDEPFGECMREAVTTRKWDDDTPNPVCYECAALIDEADKHTLNNLPPLSEEWHAPKIALTKADALLLNRILEIFSTIGMVTDEELLAEAYPVQGQLASSALAQHIELYTTLP